MAYLFRNPRVIYYLFNNETVPWIPWKATRFLKKIISKENTIFEWGSGSSTLFFSKRVKELISTEHDENWYKKNQFVLKQHNVNNCTYFFVPQNNSNEITPNTYSDVIKNFPDNFFDGVMVDGIWRNSCIKEAIPKVKSGGFILLDNSEREDYKSGVALLSDWERIDFWGPGPQNRYFWSSSFFIKK